MTNKLSGLTLDLESTNKDKLKSVFPECFTEGREKLSAKVVRQFVVEVI